MKMFSIWIYLCKKSSLKDTVENLEKPRIEHTTSVLYTEAIILAYKHLAPEAHFGFVNGRRAV